MKFYHDKKSKIIYEINEAMPEIDKARSPLTVRALTLYGMYRNGLYSTRIEKTLDTDIANFKPIFQFNYKPKEALPEGRSLSEANSLYHYASYIGLDAMKESFKKENGQCCVAYKKSGPHKIAVGFLVFYEKSIENKKMVYISHVSVSQFRQGIGTKLIQAVLMHYPPDTLFYLCARKMNQDALTAYKKLGFGYDPSYIETFGYKPHNFVGMSLTTKGKALDCSFTEEHQEEPESYFQPKSFA